MLGVFPKEIRLTLTQGNGLENSNHKELSEPIPGIVIVAILTGLLFLLKRRKEALLTLFSSMGISAVGWVIKHIIARPRPNSLLVHQVMFYFFWVYTVSCSLLFISNLKSLFFGVVCW